jgi:hypothetical protein
MTTTKDIFGESDLTKTDALSGDKLNSLKIFK